MVDWHAHINRTAPTATGGIIYVQNAAPDGPTAYMLAEAIDRPLRWMDDDFRILDQKRMHRWCDVVDQDGLCDALSSVATGRPHFLFAAQYCRIDPEPASSNPLSLAVKAEVAAKWKTHLYPLPGWMHATAGGNVSAVRWVCVSWGLSPALSAYSMQLHGNQNQNHSTVTQVPVGSQVVEDGDASHTR